MDKDRHAKYRATHRELLKEKGVAYKLKIKIEVIGHYCNGNTPQCELCKLSDIRALTIDHIDGGGNQHRKEQKLNSGYQFYLWLKRNNYPLGYRPLCGSCQMIERYRLLHSVS